MVMLNMNISLSGIQCNYKTLNWENRTMSININEQDIAVGEYLKDIYIDYHAVFIRASQDKEWKCDKWNIIIGGESFEYRTGIGHRIEPTGQFKGVGPKDKKQLTKLREVLGLARSDKVAFMSGKNTDNPMPGRRLVVADIRDTYAVMPTQASVLYCLLSDIDCADGTFSDFCDNLGYNEDSIKDRDLYFACQKTHKQMYRVFTNDQLGKLRELLEDY